MRLIKEFKGVYVFKLKHTEGKPGEEGYKQIVGGDSFNSFKDHPRESRDLVIKGKVVPSDAAGAYQIMEDTWDDANLQEYKTQYGVKDFSPLSQDLFALALLKHKRNEMSSKIQKKFSERWVNKMVKTWNKKLKEFKKNGNYKKKESVTKSDFPNYEEKYNLSYGDIIQYLIDNNLDRAMLTAAPEWASFPESPYGQEASNYTLADAKIKYREFLLQEIKGETDLHLEAGFLKKFGYDCCSENSETSDASPDGKEPIDLRPTLPWQTQMSPDLWGWIARQRVSCYRTSVQLLKFAGIKNGGGRGNKSTTVNGKTFINSNNVIQTALEENGSIVRLKENTIKAIAYIDQELEKGNPVLLGVRHSYRSEEQNYDNTTDHYVTVVGRGYENGKRFFRFYEVGTSNSGNGQHDDNKLYVNDNGSISGNPKHKPERTYTLTQVRGNKTNGNFK